MGKTQSKRSVDITTESKKNPDEDVTGKLEKIEDLDQKQVNGDASSQENVEAEKKDGDETENDKDLTTEKSGGDCGAQDGGGDSNTGQSNASTAESASKEDESTGPKDGNKSAEEISPLSDENNKKPKKEKVKKKWSFRSISFGKKDKQKPAKSEDATTENTATTNGDTAAQVGDGAATEETAEKVQKDGAAGDSEVKDSNEKPTENGESSEKEQNGEKTSTSTPIEEQPAKEISSNENTTNITNNTTETTSSVVIENSSTTATENNQTEKQSTTTVTNLAAETPESAAAVVSNGGTIENNDTETLSTADNQKDQVTDKAADLIGETSDVTAKIKSIPNVVNEMPDNRGVHQNGTSANGEELETENESKSQVEVIFQTDKAALTDELVTLNTATSSSPKTTLILTPDPTDITESSLNEISERVAINNESMNIDLTDKQVEETAVISADSATNIVVDVAAKAIEPASTFTVSATKQTEIANVDIGNVEPNEPEDRVNTPADQFPAESESEDRSKVLIAVVSATSTATESPKPPPLPVSPPPSQVSVFAFNDNNQGEEENICDTSTHIIAENAQSEPPKSAILQRKDLAHISNSQSDIEDPQSSTDEPQPCIEEPQLCTEDSKPYVEEAIKNDDIKIDTVSYLMETAPTTSAQTVECDSYTEISSTATDEEKVEEIQYSVLTAKKEDVASDNLPDSVEEVVRVPEQNINNTEDQFVMVATAVVDEITDKAVELIHQQKDNEEQQPDSSESNDILTTEGIKTDNEDIEMKPAEDEVTLQVKGVPMEEIIEQMKSSNINGEDIDSDNTQLTIESHLHDSPKVTDKHIVEEEKVFDTQICSQTVDITNAKDLKESAAAEVTTQDLPVICE